MNHEEAVSRCWAEIDLDILLSNYQWAQSMLKPGVELISVIKANAYGLGSIPVAKALWRAGARFFAVAAANEAQELIRALPDISVLVMGLAGEMQMSWAIAHDVRLTIFTMDQAHRASRIASTLKKTVRIHAKLETGLHRLGFEADGAVPQLAEIAGMEGIEMEGLYTHLALRDPESDRKQLDTLYSVRDQLKECGVDIPRVHALDSIGMTRYPLDQMDAVRLGAWLYGVCPRGYAHPEQSRLAVTLKTRVAQVKWVKAGACIGYDEAHPLEKDSLIATLSGGYVDGYPRLNHIGQVEIRGRRANVCGLVCMDQMMVDVSAIPDVREGDPVILLGGSIGVDEYAAWGAMNRNESLARINRRVPRIYIQSGKETEIVDYMETVL